MLQHTTHNTINFQVLQLSLVCQQTDSMHSQFVADAWLARVFFFPVDFNSQNASVMAGPPAVTLTPKLPWKREAVGECVITALATRRVEIVNCVWRAFIGTHQPLSPTQTCVFVSQSFFTDYHFLPCLEKLVENFHSLSSSSSGLLIPDGL